MAAPGKEAAPGPTESPGPPGREADQGTQEVPGPPGIEAWSGYKKGPGAPQGHSSADPSPTSSAASTPSPADEGPPFGEENPLLERPGARPGGPPAPQPPPKKDRPGVWAGLWSPLVSWKALSGLLAAALLTVVGLWLAYVLHAPSGGAAPREPCPHVWMYYAKHCYYYAENETDWKSASEFCEANKASLVAFRDGHEMDYILKRAGKKSYWIGLRKREKGLEWISGDLLDNSLFQTQGDEECGFIWSKNGLVISLSTCSLPRSSVCKGEPFS